LRCFKMEPPTRIELATSTFSALRYQGGAISLAFG
jgi:hypothetical protein